MYKKIILSLLLLPCMVFSKSDRDCQIEQLKNAQRDKEEKIALIVKTIDEKEDLIDSLFLKAQNVLQNISDEYEDILEEMSSFEFDLQQALIQHKSIKYLLDKKFANDSNKSEFELKRMKYIVIRYALEYMSIYKLIQQYEQHLQELLELNYKLEELQK